MSISPAPGGGRPSFAAKRASARVRAGGRARARIRTPVGSFRDPLVHPRWGLARAVAVVAALLAASLAAHVGGVVVSKAIGDLFGRYQMGEAPRPEPLRIQVREVPQVVAAEPAAPTPARLAAPAASPPPAKAASPRPPPSDPIDLPPPEATPPAQQAEPTRRRIVGLSLESTVVGGGGPAFAVGNTRMGETAPVAADPVAVPRLERSPAPNRVAAVLPVGTARIEKPRRKIERPPPYPEALRQQGVEADVAVLLSIDERGRVEKAEIVAAAAQPEFNAAARAAALAEEFEPATRDGVAIPYTIKVTYRFRLDEV